MDQQEQYFSYTSYFNETLVGMFKSNHFLEHPEQLEFPLDHTYRLFVQQPREKVHQDNEDEEEEDPDSKGQWLFFFTFSLERESEFRDYFYWVTCLFYFDML